jgi:V8-like Glu-specific endopeptidase
MSATDYSESAIDEVGSEEAEQESGEESSSFHAPTSVKISGKTSRAPSKGGEADDADGDEAGDFPSGESADEAGEEGGDESSDESGDESTFEEGAVEAGWQEAEATEAGAEEAEAEAVIDAEFASSTPESQQEFFAFLAPLLMPLAKAVIPSLAGSATSALQKLLQSRGRQRPRRRETGYEAFGADESTEEADAEAALAQLEVIIGKDDRVRMQNTKAIPWKRICHLQIEAQNGSRFLGTGALIGPRTVVTAGHCVFLHDAGGWAKSITVSPGRNSGSFPFGKAKAIQLHTVKGWKDNKNRQYDYGAITIGPGINMSPASAFGFAALPDSAIRGKKLNTAGYPGDKPAGTMWYHGMKVKSLQPRVLVYDIDTMGGQSGSPLWIKQNGKRVQVGIHTNGMASGNSGTRITLPVFNNLKKWRSI